ncbi:hypothetical protein K7X08_029192 [Anisodus acutangulus]|uniref:Uncharacterized protein n=1 Tax=Anisodus acutangulus TaxID=402998 RepID=A0A9Q1QVQ2_9SOLA|nr:hypothetical protein K7X08_029192 [Anisodus acutangulus]
MKYVTDLELLTKYCEPIAEEELQNCPFEYEYDNSPISSPSVAVTPSQPTGILMLSLPSSDSDDQSSGHENEEFETPPEQNNSSQPYFSGSDDQKPSTSATVDSQHNNGDTSIDAVNRDKTEAVDLGNDSDDLGFSNRREIDVRDIGELEEQLRKRYRISKEDLDVKKEPIVIEIDETQTQDVDTEVIECEESIKVNEQRIGRNADNSSVKMSDRSDEEGDGGELRENGERGVERNADSSTVKMSERGKSKGNGGEVRENGERGVERNEYSSTVKYSERGEEEGDGGEVLENGEKGAGGNEKLNGVSTGEMHLNGIKYGVRDGDGERGVVSMTLDEKENGGCAKEMHSTGITRSGVDVDGGGGGAGSVEGRRELPLSMRGGDKNVGLVEEVDGGGGAGSVEGRRELPLSMRGDKNVGLVEEVGRRATTENGSFKDLMEAFSVVVGDLRSDDKNDADFFETAKRRGLTFPRPRWWPPEGFSD